DAGGATFCNPAQQLEARLRNENADFRLADGRTFALRLSEYRLDAHALSLKAQPVFHHEASRAHARVSSGLVMWYVNSPLGIEQGFTLDRPPHPTATTTLQFAWRSSLRTRPTRDGLDLLDAAGRTVLHYGGLFAYDARHRPLPARMVLRGHDLALVVDTRHAVYPVTVDPLLSAVFPIQDPNAMAGDQFGASVAISADGNTVIVGAFGEDSAAGRVYVFTRSGSNWSTTPAATFLDPGATANDLFGHSVALSSDGTAAVFGAAGASAYDGKVYVYAQSGGKWGAAPSVSFSDPYNSTVGNDLFGYSVSISSNGSTALIGSPGYIDPVSGSEGRAYIYAQISGQWTSTPVYTIKGYPGNLNLGNDVALSADGHTALIGDPQFRGALSNTGAAYVFGNGSGAWAYAATLNDPADAANDYFGSNVALSANGTTALASSAVTASGAGAVYLFTQSSGMWPATPSVTFADPAATANDAFGKSIAMSADGSTVIASAYSSVGNTMPSSNTEVAYVFRQSGGTWPSRPTLSLTDPGTRAANGFGASTTLSSDGLTAVVGAPGIGSSLGDAYIFASGADLVLTASASASSISTGQQVTYDFTVSNNDSQITATGITLTDTLPAGISFVSDSAAGGNCSMSGNIVTCSFSTLAPQTEWQPTITVTAASAGSYMDSASVSSNQPDPNTANNSVSLTTTVTAPPPAPPPSGGSGSGGGGALGLPTLALLALTALFRWAAAVAWPSNPIPLKRPFPHALFARISRTRLAAFFSGGRP
ncbi:MAG: DUF7933 domain-containing protein, partial [Acidobacteriaceae bacterium]